LAKKIFFHSLNELITNAGVYKKAGVGVQERDLGIIENGALLWDSAKGILWLGKTKDAPKALVRGSKQIDCRGHFLSPALTDCHTHLVFAGSRHEEFASRVAGLSYQEISAKGGGIRSTVMATRKASEKELFNVALERIAVMKSHGVGVLEIKSGYGLDWVTERKQLRVIQQLRKKSDLRIFSTFLGAHAFPPEAITEKQRNAYVDTVVNEMLPAVRREKLADACDVFFDDGYFTEDQARRILQAAIFQKLHIKLHADELANTGGAKLAAEMSALSADHLLKADVDGISRMAKNGVVAVLLPGTAFYLGLKYPDVAMMRKQGVCFALATDYNPGSSPTTNLPFMMSLGCLQMGMTLPEAFAAATYGGANALGLHDSEGALLIGKKPKIALFNQPSYKALISQFAGVGSCRLLL